MRMLALKDTKRAFNLQNDRFLKIKKIRIVIRGYASLNALLPCFLVKHDENCKRSSFSLIDVLVSKVLYFLHCALANFL